MQKFCPILELTRLIYRIAKFKRKASRFGSENAQTILSLEMCQVTHLQDLKSFVGQ